MTKVTLKEVRQFKHRINPEERQGAYGYYFIRPFSLYLTYLSLRLGLTANQVTVMQGVVGLAGSVCLAGPSSTCLLLGIALLQFGFVLDNVDGEIARFRSQVSITGKYLDTIGHELVIPTMYFGIGVGTYFQTNHFESVIFGFLAGLFSLRLDVAAMYQEAAQFIETKHDQSFQYYNNLQAQEKKTNDEPKVYRRKNEESPIRMLYALFAYPATMNIITVIVLVDLVIPPINIFGSALNLTYLFLMVYGTLLPLRRIVTIRRLANGRETERKYVSLIETLKDKSSRQK